MNPQIVFISLSQKGSIHYALEVLKSLRQNYSVNLITSQSSFWDQQNPDFQINLSNWFSIIKLPGLLYYLWMTSKNKKTVFWFPVFHPINYVIARLFKAVITVFTIHDFNFHLGEQNSFLNRIQNLQLHIATHLILLSQHEADKIPDSFIPKINIIPHPVIQSQGVNLSPRKAPKKFKLLFLGRVSEYKGLDILKKLSQNLSSSVELLTIAGMPVTNFSIPQKSTIQLIPEYLSDRRISELLTIHDLLLLPYLEASQSGIISLALNHSIPIVMTNVGGLPEQLSNQYCIQTDPEYHSFMNGIELVISKPEIYELLSQKMLQAREDQVKYFTSRINQVCKEICGS